VRFCLFATVPLVWLGVSVKCVHAQQLVTISPEVKADALRRLELSKSAQIPKDQKKMANFYGANILRICNKGPKPSDSENQEQACSGIASVLAGANDAMPRSLDDLLPAFKACAFTNDCSNSIKLIAQSGHPDYALALAEYAPNCKGCAVLGELTRQNVTGAISATLYLRYSERHHVDNDPALSAYYRAESYVVTPIDPKDGPPYRVYKKAKEYIEIGTDDVRRLLERGCTEAGRQSACSLYQWAGGSSDEAMRSRAELARSSEESAVKEARQAQRSSSDQANNKGPGFLSALSSTLTEVQQQQGATIENANAQQQANLQALAAAQQRRQQQEAQQREQQRQQTELQARTVVAQNSRPTPTVSNTTSSASPNAASPGSTANSGYNPYSSTAAQGSYNPYTGTGKGSIQTKCTDVTGSVMTDVSWHPPVGGFCSKELDVFFTNNYSEAVNCTWAFEKNGVWHNYGGGDIQPGQRVGGESGGDWTCNPDSPAILYMCFPKSQTATMACSKQIPSNWK